MVSKNFLKVSALIVAAAFIIGAPSKKAHAIVGLSTANPALVTEGLIIGGAALLSPIALPIGGCVVGGTLGLVVGAVAGNAGDGLADGCAGGAVVGLYTSAVLGSPAFLVGLVLLPVDGSQVQVAFTPVSDAEFAKLSQAVQLTADEARSFNSEIDEVNALVESVGKKLAASGKITADNAKAIWAEHKGALSDATFSAVTKIAAYPFVAAQK